MNDNNSNWFKITSLILSIISTIGLIVLGVFTFMLNVKVENTKLSFEKENILLEQKKFESELQNKKDNIIKEVIPKILSKDSSIIREGVAILFTLYPNDAVSIIDKVSASVKNLPQDEAQKELLSQISKEAEDLSIIVGDWGIVISNDKDLEGAQWEVSKAKKLNYNPVIYFKDSWYVTIIGPYPSKDIADTINVVVRSQIRAGTYVINFNDFKLLLSSPANGALFPPGTDITLLWNSVSGAAEYLVEIWGGQYGGNHNTLGGWQGGTSRYIGTMSPGNVLWRLKARNSSGVESPWSDEWNFTPQ